MSASVEPIEIIRQVYRAACVFSRETRQRIAEHDPLHDPRPEWEGIIGRRRRDGDTRVIQATAARLKRQASRDAAAVIGRAVANLVEVVRELADFVPQYEERVEVLPAAVARRVGVGKKGGEFRTWQVTPESVRRLDGIRARARVRLIELDELFQSYPDPLARFVSVARRAAEIVLPPTRAGVVAGWLDRLAGDSTAV